MHAAPSSTRFWESAKEDPAHDDDRTFVAVGVFDDSERARDAIGALKDAGFGGDDISLLMPDRGQARDMAAETGTKPVRARRCRSTRAWRVHYQPAD